MHTHTKWTSAKYANSMIVARGCQEKKGILQI